MHYNFYHEIKFNFSSKVKISLQKRKFVSKLTFFTESEKLSSTEKNCKVYENDFNLYSDLIYFRFFCIRYFQAFFTIDLQLLFCMGTSKVSIQKILLCFWKGIVRGFIIRIFTCFNEGFWSVFYNRFLNVFYEGFYNIF